jgi:hypothetical protein
VSPMSSRHTYVFGGERKKESKKDWVRAEDTPAALAHSNSGEGGELSRAWKAMSKVSLKGVFIMLTLVWSGA